MLYVTTRNNRDAYTVQRALSENRGPDGGMYLPFRMPYFPLEELEELEKQGFSSTVAFVLNRLFRTRLTGFDVEFACGRSPVRLRQLRHRILVAELWHNPSDRYQGLEKSLITLVGGEKGGFAKIAVRTAVLFGIYGILRREGIHGADLAIVSGDFSGPISGLYGRCWGLNIGNIVCACNENRELWNLLSHGQLRTDAVCVSTPVPQADVAVPEELERLIYEAGGTAEVQRYLDICRRGGVYTPDDGVLSHLRQGMRVCVVSSQRLGTIIPSVYRTHGYLLSPDGALAYGALQDYRSGTGQTGSAVLLEERSPLLDGVLVAGAMDIPVSELAAYVNR